MLVHVDEMNTMVGSLGTLSVACKGGRDNKKKMDHYMDEFPDELQE